MITTTPQRWYLWTWRRNVLSLLKSSIEKKYTRDDKTLTAGNTNSKNKTVTLKRLMVFPSFICQKKSSKSKRSEHKEQLTRRLQLWIENKVAELLFKCTKIKKRRLERSMEIATSNKTSPEDLKILWKIAK